MDFHAILILLSAFVVVLCAISFHTVTKYVFWNEIYSMHFNMKMDCRKRQKIYEDFSAFYGDDSINFLHLTFPQVLIADINFKAHESLTRDTMTLTFQYIFF
jgi:hypothetical protein